MFAAADATAVTSGYFVDNAGSAGVQRKLGFVETGRGLPMCVPHGTLVEEVRTRLARDASERAQSERQRS